MKVGSDRIFTKHLVDHLNHHGIEGVMSRISVDGHLMVRRGQFLCCITP